MEQPENNPVDAESENPPPAEVNVTQHITTEQIKGALEQLITPETVGALTRRIIRTRLEESFELPSGCMEERKKEINGLINTLMASFQEAPSETSHKRRHSETEEPAERGSEESESDRPKAKRSGLKKAQSGMMTKSHFCETAEAYTSNIGPIQFTVTPREFSTGSCGWFYGGKKEFIVGEEKVMCQLTINCTILGSKQWKP